MSAPIPAARVLSIRKLRHTRLVRVRCPFCPRRHWHGWPFDTPDVGMRVSHCHRPAGEPVRFYRVQVDVTGGVR